MTEEETKAYFESIKPKEGLNEYIVTCKSYEDLENLYDDMETPGGSLYIPNRSVDLVHRRTISRNTHYMLTEEEAVEIRKDERVIACERPAQARGIRFLPLWTQTGDFEKTSGTLQSDDKNWGLYRMIKGDTVSNWGSDSTTEISNRTISTTASGKNVDVVIVDDGVNPNHPEFAVNPDGTGGSRVVEFNWFQYSSALGYTTPATYSYSFGGNHGTHVAGTVAGNTQGFARDANIYKMSFYDTGGGGAGVTDWAEKLWDYLRYFHKNKPINPATGRRNPTIANNSWGSSYSAFSTIYVNSSFYRGTTTSLSGLTTAQRKSILESHECSVGFNNFKGRVPGQDAAVLADATDALNDGVIIVASAGNSYWNCEEVGGPDFNNYLDVGFNIYHNRGSSPGDTPGVICVGAIGAKVAEHKVDFSNWGGRVDIWAPGENIISSVYDQSSAISEGYGPLVADSRDTSYYLGAVSGTSMSSPQITGILACLLEQEPNLTPAEALQHLIENSLPDVYDTGVAANLTPYEGFGDSNNRYSFIPKKRSDEGMASPAQLHKNRNSTTAGVKYPRVRYQTTS